MCHCEREHYYTVDKVFSLPISFSRNTTTEMTSYLKMRSGFAKPQPNLKKILGTSSFDAHQKVPSLFIEGEMEIQRGKLYCSLTVTKLL